MKLLQDFREYKATAPAREEFNKLWESKYPDLADSASEKWVREAKESAWEMLVMQDRIEQLEKKINTLMDSQNTPKEAIPA